jgi:hypothetical protein
MISNKSPAKTANTIQGIGLKGFFVREPFGFAIIRALKPACGPQSAKNKAWQALINVALDSSGHITARPGPEATPSPCASIAACNPKPRF